jgi:hypothetical protein
MVSAASVFRRGGQWPHITGSVRPHRDRRVHELDHEVEALGEHAHRRRRMVDELLRGCIEDIQRIDHSKHALRRAGALDGC